MKPTKQQIKEAIHKAHNPELANQPGMVNQIWQDGEHTCQKSGELLWQRTLHCFGSGFSDGLSASDMPILDNNPNQGYAFVSYKDAKTIYQMFKLLNKPLFTQQMALDKLLNLKFQLANLDEEFKINSSCHILCACVAEKLENLNSTIKNMSDNEWNNCKYD